jgi:hypothetical protein
VFLRVHAQYLTKAAQSSATTLTAGGLSARPLAAVARNVAQDLDRLAHSGSDRTKQRRLAAALIRAATRAAKLGQSA